MNSTYFFYDIVKLFYDTHFTNVILEHHFKELKDFGDNIKGWLVILNKEKYLLPETINNKDIRDCLPLKMLRTEDFKHSTNVYKIVTKLQNYGIPAQKTMEFRDWVQNFAPFQHSVPKQFLLYKLIILGAMIKKYNFRIASNPAFGKDSLPTVLSQLLPLDVAVYFPRTHAKLMNMIERKLLVITELPDATKANLQVLEPVIRIGGDGRPTFTNSAIAVPGMTKEIYDISQLSMGFIYNELADYQPPHVKEDRSEHYFDMYFTKATLERFLPLHFTGELFRNQFITLDKQTVFKEAHPLLKSWCMSLCWYMQNPPTQHNYKQVPYVVLSGKGRLQFHFQEIVSVLDAYCNTPEEFHELYCELINAHERYGTMITPKESIMEVQVEDLTTYS
jgi:hypothetical protein